MQNRRHRLPKRRVNARVENRDDANRDDRLGGNVRPDDRDASLRRGPRGNVLYRSRITRGRYDAHDERDKTSSDAIGREGGFVSEFYCQNNILEDT